MKNRDDIKTFIVIVSVCIICIVIAVIFNIKSNVERMEPVSEYNVFFSNVNYVNNYINYVSNDDSEAVYALLDDDYIDDNNITYDNVLNNVKNYSTGSFIKVTSMSFVEIKNNFIYYITGSILENNFDGNVVIDDNFSIILKSDFDNLTFSLYPVTDDNYEKIINSIKKIDIENNNVNVVTKSELISKEQVCIIYLSDFFSYFGGDMEKSYNLLSDEMKTIYPDMGSYVNVVNSNISKFSTVADKCLMQKVDDNRVYTVIDNNENTYVFTEESIMNYKVDFYLKNVDQSKIFK